MEPISTTVIVNLTDHPGVEPEVSWILPLDALDMSVEETIEQLQALTWSTGEEYPVMSSLHSRYGIHNWGSSSSFAEFILSLSAGGLGSLGATAIDAAVRESFRKLRDRARGDDWGDVISEEDALGVAKSRIASQYNIEAEALSVRRAQTDAVERSHEFEFIHTDGRSFGAVVGIFKDSPTCMRIWRSGTDAAS
ncbi:hypothetical protein AB0918_27045 [Streptomyces sp. NPDC006864]|uniref:hypothetical protein n=1 Tax=Streptomyces sp. NPDC006864 TaxID=3154780 RepID=UPI0034568823